MSTQQQVNTYPSRFILYYANVVNADATIYQTDLSDVCVASVKSGTIQISDWQIIGYGPPSNATLLTYPLATVQAWYVPFYLQPQEIGTEQPLEVSAAGLAAIRTDAGMTGFMVIDTTAGIPKVFDGAVWQPVNIGGGGPFLPLAGGTMTGPIDIGATYLSKSNGQNFSIGTTCTGTDSLLIDLQNGTSGAGGTGAIAIGTVANASALKCIAVGHTAGALGMNAIALGTDVSAGSQYDVAIGNLVNASSSGSVSIGGGPMGISNSQQDSIAIGNNMTLVAGLNGIAIGNGAGLGGVNDAIAIGDAAVNTLANSCLIGDAAIDNIRANSLVCDLGTAARPFVDLFLSGSVAGPANSRTADNIVANTGAAVVDNVASFSLVSGKEVKDSGIASANLFLADGSVPATGDFAMATNDINNVGALSGAVNSRLADNIVSNAGASVAANVASFSGVSGKVVQDSGIASANLFLANGSVPATGAFAMATNNISNVGTLSGAVNSRTADNIVSNAGAATASNFAAFDGATGKVIEDSGFSAASFPGNSYSMVGDGNTITNTAVQTSLFAGSTNIGSLTFGANSTQGGTVLKFVSRCISGSIDALETLTFTIRVDGADAWTIVYTNGAVPDTNLVFLHELNLKLNGDTNGYLFGTMTTLSGLGPTTVQLANAFLGGTWDDTLAHTIDWTATWGAASAGNDVSCSAFNITQLF